MKTTKTDILRLVNADVEPMQFTLWFSPRERKILRELAKEGSIQLFRDSGCLWVRRNLTLEDAQALKVARESNNTITTKTTKEG